MRRAARIDANQTAIVAAMRKMGASVAYIKLPVDLVVGYRGKTALVEIKDGAKAPSAQKHTQIQEELIASWRGGPVHTVRSVDEALETLKVWPSKNAVDWIPVAKQMPPPNVHLLVAWGGGHVDKAHTFDKWPHPSNPLGYLIQGHPGAHVDVTHWMLLPEPPK